MTILANDRTTPKRTGNRLSLPVAAGALLYAGSIVCVNAAGFATRGATSNTLVAMGVAQQRVDNSVGVDGALRVEVEANGAWLMANSASTDQITLAQVGSQCFLVDDQTVAKTNGGATRSAAGWVVDVDASGVWVRFR